MTVEELGRWLELAIRKGFLRKHDHVMSFDGERGRLVLFNGDIKVGDNKPMDSIEVVLTAANIQEAYE